MFDVVFYTDLTDKYLRHTDLTDLTDVYTDFSDITDFSDLFGFFTFDDVTLRRIDI